MAVFATAFFTILAPAGAAPVAGYDIRVEMLATVTSVTGGGSIVDAGGNLLRSFDAADLDRKPWNVGDRLSIVWQLGPTQAVDCWDGSSFYGFGGISFGGMTACSPSLPALSASLQRADGTATTDLHDGFESGLGMGPIVALATGEISFGYSTVDGLVVGDCCTYTYDPALDRILSGPGPGYCCAAPAFLFASFGETGGGGSYVFTILDAALSDIWSARTSLDVAFDVEWRSEFSRVPEPAVAGLLALACLLLAARGRRLPD